MAAKAALQESRGKILTGFTGQKDLYTLLEEIHDLARRLINDADDIRKGRRTGTRGS